MKPKVKVHPKYTYTKEGVYVGLDQSSGYLLDYSSVQINSLSALSELLLDLESSKHVFVIRGNLIEGRQQQAIRRTLKPRQGQEPNFEAASRSWCMIDIDDVPCLPLPHVFNTLINSLMGAQNGRGIGRLEREAFTLLTYR